MVAKKIINYLEEVDTNDDKIGMWAYDVGGSYARCKACPGKSFCYKKGKIAFTQHSKTQKHRDNIKGFNKKKKQLNIIDVLEEDALEQAVKKKARKFEIDLTRRLDSHNVPATIMNCLVNCIKTHLSSDDGSKIVSAIKLSKTKAEYLAKHGIAKTFLEETITKLQECDGFSVGFDESEMNKNHECEVMVMVSSKENGIELRHYRTLSLDGTDAATIVRSLLEQMDEDSVPWKQKMIAPMTDGCNTMAGCNTGVKKRLEELVPQLKDLGSCNDHHLGNAAQAGCEAFDEDVREALVNIYFDLGGAKGKGLKKKKQYEKAAQEKGRKLKALKKFGSTRFRSYRICIEPILFNWNSIVEYYALLRKPTARQIKLKSFFVDQEFNSLLKLEFIMAQTRDLNEAINYFEGRATKIHTIREKMEEILRTQLVKFMDPMEVKEIDQRDNTVKKKTGADLLSVDVYDEEKLLNKKNVSVGQKCASVMRSLDLTPSCPQLDEFYKKVFSFHQKTASKLQTYFETGLSSSELQYMTSLSPYNRTKAVTPDQIMFLATSYSKIVDVISPGYGLDKLKQEVQLYNMDDNLNDINKNHNYNSYWGEVALLTEGDDDWEVYEVLPRFARALGTPFNSGSEMERGFSRQSDILRDPKRNKMAHETLDSHMQIRYGIECKETKDKCETCNRKEKISEKGDDMKTAQEKRDEKKVCICHCKYSEINDQMLFNCAEAWRSMDGNKVEEEEEQEIQGNAEDVIDGSEQKEKRLSELKLGLKKRTTLYDPEVMKKIYETKEDRKKAAIANRSEKLKSKSKIKEDIVPKNIVAKNKVVIMKNKSDSAGNVAASSTTSSKQTKLLSTHNAGYKRVLSLPNQSQPLKDYQIPKKTNVHNLPGDKKRSNESNVEGEKQCQKKKAKTKSMMTSGK